MDRLIGKCLSCKRRYGIFAGIGFLFGFFNITESDLARQGNLVWDGAYLFRTIILSLLTGILLGLACCLLPECFERFGFSWLRTRKEDEHGSREANGRRVLLLWLVSLTLILLCWIPVYLAYYPGICAYDITIQTGQIENHSYNDHHPIAHTLLIAGSMKTGETLFGDANTGLACMVFVQLLCLAAAIAWGILLLYRRGVRRGYLISMQLSGMLYPFHFYMGVSVIKDVCFSIFFLLQMLALCEMVRCKSGQADRYDLLFAVGSLGMQLFRTNGRYALLALTTFAFIALIFGKGSRRFWRKLTVNCVLSLLIGTLCLSGLFRLTGAEQGDRREMLSMPIQQLARCMLYHGGVGVLPEDDGTMEIKDRNLINDFLLDEGYREYRPEISDPVKNHTNTYVVRYRTGDFVRTYLHLLARYPGDFVNAALAVNAGYFYVWDESHATVNWNGTDRGLGYVQTRWVDNELNPRGLYQDSKWKSLHEVLERWADQNGYLKLPLLKYLFVPGTFLWLYLLLAGVLAERRQYDRCMPILLVFGYYLTLFLGPTVQLRYIYPLMLALPFAALMLCADPHMENDCSTAICGSRSEGSMV